MQVGLLDATCGSDYWFVLYGRLCKNILIIDYVVLVVAISVGFLFLR